MSETLDQQGLDGRRNGRRRIGSRTAIARLIAVLALACSWSATAAAQQTAYTVSGSDLYVLDFASGGLTLLGDLGITGIDALAVDPSGVLYGITLDDLYTIDPSIPAATLVGPTGLFPSDQPRSMTFDADGRLWLSARGILHEVDPATGEATAIGLDQGLLALAAEGVELFGIVTGVPPPPVGQPAGSFPPQVIHIDLDGSSEILATLDGLVDDNPFGVNDMVFDPQGHAWLLAINVVSGDPPVVFHRIYLADELETGVVELVSEALESPAALLTGTMALIPDRGIVDVPTLGWTGLAVLVAALAGCALRTLRRRRQR
jgi:hypothetical protein